MTTINMTISRPLAPVFSPLHGLASLGAGGLAVSFFIWLLFLTPHPGQPVPTYETLARLDATGQASWIPFVSAMIVVLAIAHYALLAWWLRTGRNLPIQTKEQQYRGESHIFKMLAPLILAMSVNVGFVVGLVFVPGLWSIKEWLFPGALIAFAILFGVTTMRWVHQQRLLRSDQLDYRSKGLIELLATFAFAMITVGFSASAAMSQTPWIHGTGTFLALASGIMAIWAALIVLRDRLPNLKQHPIAATATGSLLMGVPILTVLGIAAYRLLKAGQHHFGLPIDDSWIVAVLGMALITQVLIFLWAAPRVLKFAGFRTLVLSAPQGSSFSLICPGVGLFVMSMFFAANAMSLATQLPDWVPIATYSALAVIQGATRALFVHLLLNAMPRKKTRRFYRTPNPSGVARTNTIDSLR
jgi:hypothetical protein